MVETGVHGPEQVAAAGKRLHVPAIDGLRGYAALAVLLVHVTYAAGRPPLDEGIIRSLFISGSKGVDFFFVISGFVLFLPVATNGGRFASLRSYGVRRVARILPAYYFMLIGIVVLYPLLASATDPPYASGRGALSILLHLTFLEHSVGWLFALPLGFVVNPVVWTLTIEALFYAILPLVAGWYYRRPLLGLAIALALAAVWKQFATSQIFLFAIDAKAYDLRLPMVTQLPTFLGHFAAGMTAAWLLVKLQAGGHRLAARVAVPLQALALTVILLTMRSAGIRDLNRGPNPYTDGSGNWHFESWTHTTRVGLAFAVLLVATTLGPRWSRWPVTNRPARWVGEVSYGVYLWHYPIILFALTTLHLTPDGTNQGFFQLLAVTLGGSLLLGWLSLILVERPFIRWARRRTPARKHPPDYSAPARETVVTSTPAAGSPQDVPDPSPAPT